MLGPVDVLNPVLCIIPVAMITTDAEKCQQEAELAVPFSTRAQDAIRMRKIGVLMNLLSDDLRRETRSSPAR
jgi:hypothetical protein